MNKDTIIVTGGAGYIGSHAVRALEAAGYRPVIVDDLSRGHASFCDGYDFHPVNVLDSEALHAVFSEHKPVAVMHFAAFIEVAESVQKPDLYMKNNVEGVRCVLSAMKQAGTEHLIFSSTAAVYGQVDQAEALAENLPLRPINPYGESKLAAERLIEAADHVRSVRLRYFNAAGASDSGAIGEAHFPETHLVPLVLQAALGMRESISIFGSDYPTRDGSCVRDYIHVEDLADAHVKALEYLMNGGNSDVFNLGSSAGYSVKEIIAKAEEVVGHGFEVHAALRRTGDPPTLIASHDKITRVLGWTPRHDLDSILKSAYDWHQTERYRELYERASKAQDSSA